MLWKLILLLTIVPLVELYLLVKLTDATGSFWVTVVVIVGTGVVGAFLAKLEGLRVLKKIQHEMAELRLPGDSLLDGAMILVAAALLVTPGLLTDTVGFLLLLPPSRAVARGQIKRWLKRKIQPGQVHFHRSMGFGPISEEPPPGPPPEDEER